MERRLCRPISRLGMALRAIKQSITRHVSCILPCRYLIEIWYDITGCTSNSDIPEISELYAQIDTLYC